MKLSLAVLSILLVAPIKSTEVESSAFDDDDIERVNKAMYEQYLCMDLSIFCLNIVF